MAGRRESKQPQETPKGGGAGTRAGEAGLPGWEVLAVSVYYLRFHSGEIQATSSQECVVEPASEVLRLWCRSVCTFLSSKARDI